MKTLQKIIDNCKCSVSVEINQHKDYYQTVKEYILEHALTDEELIQDIGEDIYQKMQETDTVIEVQAYPDTPIGSYKVYHYDLEKALEIMFNCVKKDK